MLGDKEDVGPAEHNCTLCLSTAEGKLYLAVDLGSVFTNLNKK